MNFSIGIPLFSLFKVIDKEDVFYMHEPRGSINIKYIKRFNRYFLFFSKPIKINGKTKKYISGGNYKYLEKVLEKEGWSNTIFFG